VRPHRDCPSVGQRGGPGPVASCAPGVRPVAPAMLLQLRAVLRCRRLPIHSAAATFFTSSGSEPLAPPPAPAESADGSEQDEGSLAQRLERAASVSTAIRGLMAAGRAVHRGHVFHAINRLRRRRLHRTGLQVLPFLVSASSILHLFCFVSLVN
jgi:hypothetical protein